MKLVFEPLVLAVFIMHIAAAIAEPEEGTGNMVKMCLFYNSPSGHARTDPILSQTCTSDHVHTFYGPQNFHPNTSYDDIKNSTEYSSSTPFVENQSLYWHPSIYRMTKKKGKKTYTRVSDLDSSPYYRWDNSVSPKTEAFPPEFRMIAHSSDPRALLGGEWGKNLYVECCNDGFGCETIKGKFEFPRKNCDMLGIAFAMPTCWNGDLGINNNHKDHMAYTLDGTVHGDCPPEYNRRLPQVQFFVRIHDYEGKKYRYTLADEKDVYHLDFMNGWEEEALKNIIDNCQVNHDVTNYNPPCDCTEEFLSTNFVASGAVCDTDVRNLVIDEATDVVNKLPRGSCKGDIIPKSWSFDPPLSHSNMEIEIKGDENSKSHKNKWILFKQQGRKKKKIHGAIKIKEEEKSWTLSCLSSNECYIFRMTDKNKDGIPDGFYGISFNDEWYEGNFQKGRNYDVRINCD